MNRKDLQAPTLVGPPRLYHGSGPLSCTTPQQPTIHHHTDNHPAHCTGTSTQLRMKLSWHPKMFFTPDKKYCIFNNINSWVTQLQNVCDDKISFTKSDMFCLIHQNRN